LTVALILLLERTRLGPLGLVLAVVVTSTLVAVLGWGSVALVRELSEIPRALPLPQAPMLRLVPPLAVPALSLAFVGLVQGAAISATSPTRVTRADDGPDLPYREAREDQQANQQAHHCVGVQRPSSGSR
jgi:sulfate permease, SulP family